jgi:Rieske Fe-S protein
VSALAVVVATNSPFNDMVAIHTKQAAYLTYAIGAVVPRGSIPRGLFWDTLDPYHYVRLAPIGPDQRDRTHPEAGERELLIVGGEDHKTGQARDQAQRFDRLEQWTRERFPMVEKVGFRWSGQVMETIDGLAFIGRNPGDRDNVFIITGDSGMGMTHGTIGGILISDLILGRDNPWTRLYDPSRKPVGAVGDYASENLNVAGQYADWLTGGEVSDRGEIPVGEGAVLRRGLSKVAVYREADDEYHEVSAVCPHLGCIVAWNTVEKSWDCPCHGSRFDCRGDVLNAPANRGLAPCKE